MGNYFANQDNDLNNNSNGLSSTSSENEQQKQNKFCCFKCCCEETTYWTSQIKRFVKTKYRKYGWARYILGVQLQFDDCLQLQNQLTQEVVSLIKQNSSLHTPQIKEFNIQFKKAQSEQQNEDKPNTMSQFMLDRNSLLLINTQKGMEEEQKGESINGIDMPRHANSIMDDYQEKNQESVPQSQPKNIQKRTYRRTMSLIESHLQISQNPLKKFIETYFLYFKKKLVQHEELQFDEERSMQPLMISRQSNQEQQEQSQLFVDDIKGFADFYSVAIYLFYRIEEIFDEDNYFTVENLTSFGLTLLFRNEFLYTTIFQKIQELNRNETDEYYQNVLALQQQRPSYFGVPIELELLTENIEHLKKQTTEIPQHDQSMQTIQNLSRFSSIFAPIRFMSQTSKDTEVPYFTAIQQMKLLTQINSPVHQLKLLSKITDLIQKSINKFYRDNNLQLVKNFGADELIPILVYVIIKSRVRELGTYLKFIENFTPISQLNSSAGYKLVTLQNCFHVITKEQGAQRTTKSQSTLFNINTNEKHLHRSQSLH